MSENAYTKYYSILKRMYRYPTAGTKDPPRYPNSIPMTNLAPSPINRDINANNNDATCEEGCCKSTTNCMGNCWGGYWNMFFKYDAVKIVSLILVIATIILVCTLVPLSFNYVRYDQYAFKKNVYGSVDTTQIYQQGRYFFPIVYTMVKFPSTYQMVTLTGLSVFTQDGFQVNVNVKFMYLLPPDNLADIYEKYSINYLSAISSIAKLTIKSLAGSVVNGSSFVLSDYVLKRGYLEGLFSQALSNALLNQIGVVMPASSFKLMFVDVPQAMINQYLQTVMQGQTNILQQQNQQVAAVISETNTMVSQTTAQVNFTLVSATIQADQLTSNTQSDANNIMISARGIGLRDMFTMLNITSQDDKTGMIEILAYLGAIEPAVYKGFSGQLIVNN